MHVHCAWVEIKKLSIIRFAIKHLQLPRPASKKFYMSLSLKEKDIASSWQECES